MYEQSLYLLSMLCLYRNTFVMFCDTCREFMPSLDEFFAEAIEQADPTNMVEDEYK